MNSIVDGELKLANNNGYGSILLRNAATIYKALCTMGGQPGIEVVIRVSAPGPNGNADPLGENAARLAQEFVRAVQAGRATPGGGGRQP